MAQQVYAENESVDLVCTDTDILGMLVHHFQIGVQSGGCVVGAHDEMQLRVVGVLVILYAVVSDDVGDRAAVGMQTTQGQAQTLAGRPRRLQWRVIRVGPS